MYVGKTINLMARLGVHSQNKRYEEIVYVEYVDISGKEQWIDDYERAVIFFTPGKYQREFTY